ncbi:MAG: F0F1 ATP synthase subunit B [Betaproteobacteria bacterium]|nr:F0F1 ATP synthase subunit B [Betaproteobacteria bacterium]
MNVNISFVGQMITFAILIWVTMKFVWPPLIAAIDRRNKEIADGLAAAEQGRQSLEEAKGRQQEMIADARSKASETMREGKQRHDDIVAAAADEAQAEKQRIIAEGHRQIEAERAKMVLELRENYAALVVDGARRILKREFDAKTHSDMIDKLAEKI